MIRTRFRKIAIALGAALAFAALSTSTLVTSAQASGVPSPLVTAQMIGSTGIVTMSTSATLHWSGTDTSGSTIAAYALRVRYSSRGTAYTAYQNPVAWQNMAASSGTSKVVAFSRGVTYCFSVRAVDFAGRFSEWSADQCLTTVLDDAALAISSGASRGPSASYYAGTYTKLSGTAQHAGLPVTAGTRVTILGTKCSFCGAMDVYLGGVKLGRVSFTDPKTSVQQLRVASTYPIVNAGVLVLQSVSPEKVIFLDGVAFRR